jgi:hypothetical protein
MPINPLLSGLIWTALVLCLLISGVHSQYPEVVSTLVSTSSLAYTIKTGAGSNILFTRCRAGSPFNSVGDAGQQLVACANSGGLPGTDESDGVAVFTKKMDMSTKVMIAPTITMDAVLKDSLTLVVSHSSRTLPVFTMQVSGSSLASSASGSITVPANDCSSAITEIKMLIDDPHSDILLGFHSGHAIRIYTSTLSTSVSVGCNVLPGTTATGVLYTGILHEASNAYIVATDVLNTAQNPIINKADLAPAGFIGDVGSNGVDYTDRGLIADNLSADTIYLTYGDAGGSIFLCKVTTSTLTTTPAWTSNTSVNYLNGNNIMNFGPYQYVVTIPKNIGSITGDIVFISKITMNAIASVTAALPHYALEISTAGLFREYDRMYFTARMNDASQNFQSYYLTVDRCVNRDGSLVCLECLPEYYRDSTTEPKNKCLLKIEFPPFFGADTANKLIKHCSDNCVKCVDNYQICTECDQANGYAKIDGRCSLPPNSSVPVIQASKNITVVEASYTRSTNMATIAFNTSIMLLIIHEDCSEQNLTLIDDVKTVTYSWRQLGCQIVDIKPNGFSIKFNSQYSITKGRLIFKKNNCLRVLVNGSVLEFDHFPIEIKDVTMGDLSATAKAGRTSLEIANSLRTPLTLIAMASSPSSSMIMDNIYCRFLMLLMLAGPLIVKPNEILIATVSMNMIPFSFSNPFDSFDKQATCNLSEQFDRNGLSCSIFGNYGEDLIVLMVTLAINITSTVCLGILICRRYRLRIKEIENSIEPGLVTERQRLSNRLALVSKINDILGIKYFMTKMEGIKFEILFYLTVNYSNSSTINTLAIGNMIGIAVVAYYLVVVVLSVFMAAWIWENIPKAQKKFESRGEEVPKVLGELISLEDLPIHLKPMIMFFQQYTVPGKFYYLLDGPISFFRLTIQAAVIVALQDSPIQQMLIVLFIEVAYLVYSIKSNIKASRSLKVTEYATNGMCSVYIIVKMISTDGDLSEKQRQNTIGEIMVVILYGIIVVSISFALFSLILILFQLCKRAILWYKNRNVSKVKPNENVNETTMIIRNTRKIYMTR